MENKENGMKIPPKLFEILPKSPVIKINLYNNQTDFRSSKVGGAFFWPNQSPPKMLFLAQINLSELPKNKIFPETGLLQFFVTGNYECNYMYKNGGGMVFYHRNVDSGIPVVNQFTNSPILQECGMTFELTREYMSSTDYRFEEYIKEYPEMWDELYDAFSTAGSKLLGFPYFTQEDPRSDARYDTLLFQLDSQHGYVMWGDCGVGNFFINSEALKKMDFSDVLFNWDCC